MPRHRAQDGGRERQRLRVPDLDHRVHALPRQPEHGHVAHHRGRARSEPARRARTGDAGRDRAHRHAAGARPRSRPRRSCSPVFGHGLRAGTRPACCACSRCRRSPRSSRPRTSRAARVHRRLQAMVLVTAALEPAGPGPHAGPARRPWASPASGSRGSRVQSVVAVVLLVVGIDAARPGRPTSAPTRSHRRSPGTRRRAGRVTDDSLPAPVAAPVDLVAHLGRDRDRRRRARSRRDPTDHRLTVAGRARRRAARTVARTPRPTIPAAAGGRRSPPAGRSASGSSRSHSSGRGTGRSVRPRLGPPGHATSLALALVAIGTIVAIRRGGAPRDRARAPRPVRAHRARDAGPRRTASCGTRGRGATSAIVDLMQRSAPPRPGHAGAAHLPALARVLRRGDDASPRRAASAAPCRSRRGRRRSSRCSTRSRSAALLATLTDGPAPGRARRLALPRRQLDRAGLLRAAGVRLLPLPRRARRSSCAGSGGARTGAHVVRDAAAGTRERRRDA